MPWKLISFLFFLILTTLFIAFNLENRSNVSFVFYEFKDIPVFVSLLFAYCAGCISMMPFLLFRKKKTVASKNPGTVKKNHELKDTSTEKKSKFGKKYPQSEYRD